MKFTSASLLLCLLAASEYRGILAAANLNRFTGSLYGVPVVPITTSGDPSRRFQVGTEKFAIFGDACDKSCELQSQQCGRAALASQNSASGCNAQLPQCKGSCKSGLAKLVAEGTIPL
ncbi:hypothetical protein BKA69DRAFT_1044638 [Paraphysoderma sedebokerense]|nr:hypothetical protein BKA69DRAFT_1044638 [Paraphysoderma sedebokerense]